MEQWKHHYYHSSIQLGSFYFVRVLLRETSLHIVCGCLYVFGFLSIFDYSVHKSKDSSFSCLHESKEEKCGSISFGDLVWHVYTNVYKISTHTIFFIHIEKEASRLETTLKCNTIWDFISMTLQLCFAFYYYRFFGTQLTIVTQPPISLPFKCE